MLRFNYIMILAKQVFLLYVVLGQVVERGLYSRLTCAVLFCCLIIVLLKHFSKHGIRIYRKIHIVIEK